MQPPADFDLRRAAVRPDAIAAQDDPIPAMHEGIPKRHAASAVAEDGVVADQMVGVTLPDRDSRLAVLLETVAAADAMGRPQAVEETKPFISLDFVLLEHVAHRAAARMEAAAAIVVYPAAAHEHVRALLKADRVSPILSDFAVRDFARCGTKSGRCRRRDSHSVCAGSSGLPSIVSPSIEAFATSSPSMTEKSAFTRPFCAGW